MLGTVRGYLQMVLFMLWGREEGKRGSSTWDHIPKNPQGSAKQSRIHYIDGRNHLREVSWPELLLVLLWVTGQMWAGWRD